MDDCTFPPEVTFLTAVVVSSLLSSRLRSIVKTGKDPFDYDRQRLAAGDRVPTRRRSPINQAIHRHGGKLPVNRLQKQSRFQRAC